MLLSGTDMGDAELPLRPSLGFDARTQRVALRLRKSILDEAVPPLHKVATKLNERTRGPR